MVTVLAYVVSLILIVISVFITLIFKHELEKLFSGEKEVFAFHLFNVLITSTVAFAAHAVITIYLFGQKGHFVRDGFILMAMLLPIYLFGHFRFEKYKSHYRRYTATEKRKVLVLNDKYLKKKKWFKSLKHYNSISRKE